jgi:hypothetical protein
MGGGGACHGGPNPQTLPVSVKLSRFVSLVENGVPKDSVEVVLTKTGKKEIVLPTRPAHAMPANRRTVSTVSASAAVLSVR